MKNWNSKTQTWEDIIKPDTREKAMLARFLKFQGWSTKRIAKELGLSESRIKEYFKDEV